MLLPNATYAMGNPPVMVLAGGIGSRLRPAVSELPKPLAPAGAVPFLQHLLENWRRQGVDNFFFLLHYRADDLQQYLESERIAGPLKGCHVSIVRELTPMGTGGAVAHAVRVHEVKGSFLVANADTWIGDGVTDVSGTVAPAMAVVHVSNTGRYGAVHVERSQVVSFAEKQGNSGVGWINAGLYHLHADLFREWDGAAFSLERDLFPQLVCRGQLSAVQLRTEFIDIGIPDDYYRFCRWIDGGKTGVL